MIILVMVAGLRIKQHSAEAASTETVDTTELEQALIEEAAAKRELGQLQRRLDQIRSVIAERRRERVQAAADIELNQRQLESMLAQIGESAQQEFALREKVEAAKVKLAELSQRRREIEVAARQSVQIKSLPTPLSTAVTGSEAHYQLLDGRISHIPLEALTGELRRQAEVQVRQMGGRSELIDSVGPMNGFRLRYVLEKSNVSGDFGIGGSIIRLTRWQLIPLSARMGENLDKALADNSDFRSSLQEYVPGRTTITIWTYPDSFREFRAIKEVLYNIGFDTAARPLPIGMPVMGSPEGSRSSAQ